MNPFSVPDKVFICPRPQDMRAGCHRLAALVTAEFQKDAMDGSLYVFISRDARKCKMLRFDINGWMLTYCTLAEGCFKWQFREGVELLFIEQRRLFWLLDGIDPDLKNAPSPITSKRIL